MQRPAAWWNIALKVGLLLALLGAAWYQVFHQRDLAELWREAPNPFRSEALPALGIVLVLVLLNWGLESEKWRLLIRPVQILPALTAFSAVLSGITLGLFTPNRVGEYGGRVLYLHPANRWSAVSLSLIGSFAQILVTLTVGLACGRVFQRRHPDFPLDLPEFFFPLGLLLLVLAAAVYLILPLGVTRWLLPVLPRRVSRHVYRVSQVGFRDLVLAFLLSAARYAVFTAQYLVLARVFGITLPLKDGITSIGTIFLIQSVLPSFAAVELLKRGNIALLVFGFFSVSEISVLATSSTLWLLNLVLPAVAGYLLLLRRDFFRPASEPAAHENTVPADADRVPSGYRGSP